MQYKDERKGMCEGTKADLAATKGKAKASDSTSGIPYSGTQRKSKLKGKNVNLAASEREGNVSDVFPYSFARIIQPVVCSCLFFFYF